MFIYFTGVVRKTREYRDTVCYTIVRSKCFLLLARQRSWNGPLLSQLRSIPCATLDQRVLVSVVFLCQRSSASRERAREREGAVARDSFPRSDDRGTRRKTKRTRSGGMGRRKECLPRVSGLSSHYRSYLSTVDRAFLRTSAFIWRTSYS